MKSSTARIIVTMPAELLKAAEAKLMNDGEGAGEMICRLLEAALREVQERDGVARYTQAYRARPQTEDEVGWSDEVSEGIFSELPWE